MVRIAEPSASASTTASATLFPGSVFAQSEDLDLGATKLALKGRGALGVGKTVTAADILQDVILRPVPASVRPVMLAVIAAKVRFCVLIFYVFKLDLY